ncbi:MAG: hypothetical protein U5K99_10280 [Anaerolineales bacterium]|nr:hypothetical protein [Anaerolineales bacterium]
MSKIPSPQWLFLFLAVICSACGSGSESTPSQVRIQPPTPSPPFSGTMTLELTDTPLPTATESATPLSPTVDSTNSKTETTKTFTPAPTQTETLEDSSPSFAPNNTSLPPLTNQPFNQKEWSGIKALEPGNLEQLTFLGIQYLDPRRRAVNFKLHDWSVGGRWILTCTEKRSSGTYQVFDLEAGLILSEISFQGNPCKVFVAGESYLQFSRDGNLFSGRYNERNIIDLEQPRYGVYDSKTGGLVAPLEKISAGMIQRFAFSSQGTRLALNTYYPPHPASTADANVEGGLWNPEASDIQLFDVESGEHWGVFLFRERWNISDLEFSTRGNYLVAGGLDEVTAWHMEGEQVTPVNCPWARITFSPTAEVAALACRPHQDSWYQLLWDPSSGALNRVTGAPETQYQELTFSPDGRLVAALSETGKVSIWHGVSGKHIHTLPYTFRSLKDLHFISQGKLLALLKSDGTLLIFGLE